MSYFVTGATGFIGRFLVEELLDHREGDIYVLVRKGSLPRMEAMIRRWDTHRVIPVVGDLSSPGLGVAKKWVTEHAGEIDHFFHLAAIYDMTADDATNEEMNVGGTRNALQLADALKVGCFHQVSSVAAAGEYHGHFDETMFDEGQTLPSPYHRTKFESEKIVREEATVRAKKLEKFVAGNEQDFNARLSLGLAYLEANDLEQGLAILQTCLEQAPSDVGAWRGWLRAIYQQGDLDKLAAELDRAPGGMSQLSGFWKLQAIVAQDRRNWARAADSLAKANELSPFEADLHSQYAVVLARLNQQELAEEHGRRAKQLRTAQADLRVAYEDWLQQSASGKLSDSFAEVARRIASAYRLLGIDKEAEAWDAQMDSR